MTQEVIVTLRLKVDTTKPKKAIANYINSHFGEDNIEIVSIQEEADIYGNNPFRFLEKTLINETKIHEVQMMDNPIIIMNEKSLKYLFNKFKTTISNTVATDKPTYQNIPIIVRNHIKDGGLIIIDDKMHNII